MAAKRRKSSLPAGEDPAASDPLATHSPWFPVVGIGTSAGGLAAIEALFKAMPAAVDPGMAFVLVQHLAPDHKSVLSDLVKRFTRMQVFEVQDGMVVRPNCAYTIPPNYDLAYLNGALHLMQPSAPRGHRFPVDYFFRTLAQDQHERAIGIVLSGAGSDGALGARAVKGEGGMVMVQDPVSTEHDGMPRSAIATGLVDYVLPPAQMPAQLMAYARHAFAGRPRPVSAVTPKIDDVLAKAIIIVRARTGHDFSGYKQSTIWRRIQRRMAVHLIANPSEYLGYLQKNPAEVESLFQDFLVRFTRFFHEPETFNALETELLPRILSGRPDGSPIRVWVPGCSTGEEAYSIAIQLQERLELLQRSFQVQVFATDIDRHALDVARAGIYLASISADVSPPRLARWFVPQPDGSGYRVAKVIRDALVFSVQNVLRDPPFSRLDLISCRNLLIYMDADFQRKLIPLLHYALNPGGFLALGPAESIGEFSDLFRTLGRKSKLYQRKPDNYGLRHPALMRSYGPPAVERDLAPRPVAKTPRERTVVLRELIEGALLEQYAPPAALVSQDGEIHYLHGQIGLYLEPAQGEAGMNILKMAREGLRRELTIALHAAACRKQRARHPGVRMKTNGVDASIKLEVRPIAVPSDSLPGKDLFLVLFEEAPAAPPPANGRMAAGARLADPRHELRAKEEYLQSSIEQMETFRQELRSSQEEMQYINRELQFVNEEMETSREEVQSINEELVTSNAELLQQVAGLSRANNDLNNLLAGAGIATIFVDLQLRIQRFTPAVTQVINLIPADIGRPLGHIVSNLAGYTSLVEDLQAVLDSLSPREVEVQTHAGAWYLLRIRPYRTVENAIEGAVILFFDITAMKLPRDEEMRSEVN